MGQTVSICNLTNLIINVSIGQGVPLYFENQLKPDHCINRTVGKVWFTVTAVPWQPSSEFRVSSSVRPLVPVGADAIGGISVLDPEPSNKDRNVRIKDAVDGTEKIIKSIFGTDPRTSQEHDDWWDGVNAEKKYVYATNGLYICVSGGLEPQHIHMKDGKQEHSATAIKKKMKITTQNKRCLH